MCKKTCIGCGKSFQTSNNSLKCFDCTLIEITGGLPPEEGDFNTAKIQSGTMTQRERQYLQQDLASVELGTTTEEEYQDFYYPEETLEESKLVEAYVGSTNCHWFSVETIEEGTFDAWVDKMKALHKEQCGCPAEFQFSHS